MTSVKNMLRIYGDRKKAVKVSVDIHFLSEREGHRLKALLSSDVY